MRECVIYLNELNYRYSAGGFELKNISLDVQRGDFVAIMGGNGSGKTTLLKLIVGLLKPTSGRVLTGGARMGFVFQDPDDQLFMPTVGEDVAYAPLNMGLPGDEIEKRVDDSLKAVGIAELRNASINLLSDGQKKRAAIAGVLAMGADALVLDEPTAGLDPAGTSAFMKLLKRLNVDEGLTVVMATHDVDLVPVYAKKVLILRRGEPAACGDVGEVFSRSDIVRDSDLRLPRVAHLAEVVKKSNGECFEGDLPLTIGQARKGLMRAFEKEASHRIYDGDVRGGGS